MKCVFVWILLLAGMQCMGGRIVFSPHWIAQAQFAGYYVALEKGFYADAGLEVVIDHPSPSVSLTSRFLSKEVDIVSSYLSTGLILRSQGVQILHLMQVSQNSGVLIVMQKEFTDPSQLDGKRVAHWKAGFSETARCYAADKGYQFEWVKFISGVNFFTSGAVDAILAMYYSEYYEILMQGADITEKNIVRLADYYNVPEDALFCAPDFYARRKEDVDKFIEATKRGWLYAQENEEETLELVLNTMKANNIPANRVQQRWMLNKILEMQKNPETGKHDYVLNRSQFDLANEVLLRNGMIANQVKWESFVK